MILIPEHPIFTRDEEGQPCSFDLRRFNDDLREAFRRNGVQDAWLVDQFQLSIEEKLRTETMRDTPLSEQEIDTLLTSVLTASGYSDVASAYAELRGSNPLRGLMAALSPWDEPRLVQTLTKRLPLTPRLVSKLVPLCRDALKRLNISSVSDEFIIALAIHLAHDDNKPAVTDDTSVPRPKATPLRTIEQMLAEAPPFTRRLVDEGILSVLPAAKLFPQAQVSLSLQDFCRVFTSGWPSELAFARFFGPVAEALLNLLAVYRQSIAEAFPNLADSASLIIIPNYEDFIVQTFGPSSKTGRLAFDHAIRGLLEAMLVSRSTFELTLKYR